jgi:CDP-glycerol glycerophosphotransferase (TagB/SpsB family)
MPASSALITDYSSIYMDYLLLDKPVLFLVPDLERYVREDRDLQFDFGAMTPGPKLASWPELAAELARQLDQDSYSTERRRLRQLGFDDLPQGNSVPALIDFMRGRSWLPETNDRQCRPA